MSTFLTCQVKRISVSAGLPSIKQDLTGINGVVGNGIAGQINGFIKAARYDDGWALDVVRDNAWARVYQYDIDASRCSNVYGNSSTVTPLSLSTKLIPVNSKNRRRQCKQQNSNKN